MNPLPCLLFTLALLFGTAVAHAAAKQATFAIVGGGTAGSALAGKLCVALPHAKIVLLERAPPRDADAEFLVRSPRNAWEAWGSDTVSEIFATKPNPGLNGRTSTVVTGNTLGGSSATNAMQFTVPLPGTVASWGIRGLSESVAAKLFRKVQKKVGFRVQRPPLTQKYTPGYLAASRRAGFVQAKGPFAGKDRDDIWVSRVAADEQDRRVDAFTAYVAPWRNNACKDNLVVIEDATVTRIILRRRGGKLRAAGIEYVSTTDRGASGKKRVFVTDEVIVSAGPYGSPKLLQLSGIGPRDVLKAAGIAAQKILPVGTKTQGRPIVVYFSLYTGVRIEPSNNKTLLEDPASRAQFEAGKGGVYGAAIGATNGRVKGSGYTSMATSFGPGEGLGDPLLGTACLTNPESFGSVRVVDKDPFASLEVNSNVFGAQVDVDRMVKCLQRMDERHAQMAAKFKIAAVSPTGRAVNESYARDEAGFALHFVGGCRVGGVVNAWLSVRGVRGLRVVDASVFKAIPASAGPMASTYVVAEFIADRLVRRYARFAR